MLVIYEPLCKGFSHEKINSGFIYSFSKAFPIEKIYFYAHKTHIEALKNILNNDNLSIDNLIYKQLPISRNFTLLSFLINIYNLLKLRSKLKFNKDKKLFLTSYNTLILYIIKSYKCFSEIKFYIVLHGSFEEINSGELFIESNQVLKYKIPQKTAAKRLKNINFSKLTKYIVDLVGKLILKTSIFRYFFIKKFNTKKILEWRSNKNITFIAISKHIIINANKIFEYQKLNIKYHFYPNYFREKNTRPNNQYIKFGIFGYGDPLVLYNISKKLELVNVQNKFEIRVIGMDNSISNFFSFITTPSNGLPLSRKQMEHLVSDIDILLILYSNQKYRLSCSATIIEALSYCKPIIYFKNDCISYFNNNNLPIGFEANSVDDFVKHMSICIDDFILMKEKFNEFSENIMTLRNAYSIENNYKNLIDLWNE